MVLFGAIEAILFVWVFGMDKAWEEIHVGAQLQIPKVYKFIIKYITPLFLIFVLGFWFVQQGLPVILMHDVPADNRIFVLGTRLGLLIIFAVLCLLVKLAWRKKRQAGELA